MNQRLGLIEFSEVFRGQLDTFFLTTEVHLEQNELFYSDAIFKIFDVYQRSEVEYSVSDLIKVFHCFLYSMFKNKPSLDKNDDEIIVKY